MSTHRETPTTTDGQAPARAGPLRSRGGDRVRTAAEAGRDGALAAALREAAARTDDALCAAWLRKLAGGKGAARRHPPKRKTV